jgi:signal transduction histidine kinase
MTDDDTDHNDDRPPQEDSVRSSISRRFVDGGSSRRRLFRSFPDPLVYYEIDRGTAVIRAVNPAFERTFDVDESSVRNGRLVDHLLIDTADGEPTSDRVLTDAADDAVDADDLGDSDANPDAEDLWTRLDAGESVTVGFRDGTDGEWEYFRLEAVPVPDAGTEGYVVYICITELQQRVQTLRTRVDRLERVARITAHDLRNPLGVAKIRLEAARDTGEAIHFEKVEGALDRIQRLVQDVLSVGGRAVEPSEKVALADVVEAAWSSVTTADATLALEEGLPTITADADTLRQLFENLFRNAIEHGGRDVTVTVGGLPDGFYVADDGSGVASTERDRAFDPGYSTTDSNTGLGLAIVQQIVDDHGWQVALSSSDSGGARFAFRGVDIRDPA